MANKYYFSYSHTVKNTKPRRNNYTIQDLLADVDALNQDITANNPACTMRMTILQFNGLVWLYEATPEQIKEHSTQRMIDCAPRPRKVRDMVSKWYAANISPAKK